MGLDPTPLVSKFVPPGIGIKASEQVRLPIAKATNPGTLWVPLDVEGIYYKLPFNDGAKTYIIQNIVEVVAQHIHYFLDRPTGLEEYDEVIVDLRSDLSSPPNKALTRGTDETAPKTENFKEGDDGALLWFDEFNRRSGTTLRSSSGEIDVKKALNFELPLSKKQRELRGTEDKYCLGDYFKNPHFKGFVNAVVFATVLEFIKFDKERRKGIVIARSRNFSQMKRPTGREPIPAFLNCVYEEADNYFGIISVIAQHPDRRGKPCDILAISSADDGDVFLVLLAASNRRILNDVDRYPRIGDIQFANSVTFRRSGVYYDINKLYRELMLSINSCVHVRRNFVNPILAAFVPILLSGSDYVEKTFPGISVGSLTAAFFRHINSMTDLVTNHTANPSLVLVNPETLARLVMRAYEEKTSAFKANMSDFSATMKAYAEHSKGFKAPTVKNLRVAAAQLSWSLTYYTSRTWQLDAPNPFETSPKGTPIWGYSRSERVNGDGRYTVTSSEDADVEYMLFLDKAARTPNPDSPPKVLSEPISPVDNSYKLPARI